MNNPGVQEGLSTIGAAGGVLGILFLIAMLIAALAPVILAADSGRVTAVVVTLSLLAASVTTSLVMTTIFGNILSVLIWLGALICGAAAWAAAIIERALRKAPERIPGPRRATEPVLQPRRDR